MLETLIGATLLWLVLAVPVRLAGVTFGRTLVLRRVHARAECETWMNAWLLPVWVNADDATTLRARMLRDDWRAAVTTSER